jgi:poly(hydroxyalkanoate) depolymerase family esterase
MLDFGTNPGELQAKVYVPSTAKRGSPLVVVLHGCTQTADAYDRGAAWSDAADRHGLVLLFPEQTRANNPNLCFNWFSPRDARRGRGEALSIVQMIETIHSRHGTDPARVFVTGLSAGGAMATVMLATYPEVFAGGAIIAGLPFATANNVPQALERMRGCDMPDAVRLGKLVRSASSHSGPWPTLSVWHGKNDYTVVPSNAAAIVDQWRDVHGAAKKPRKSELVRGHSRSVWCDPTGREVIEEYQIEGFGHGTPLNTRHSDSHEVAGPHMLEAGISSTQMIVRFWGLAKDEGPGWDTSAAPPEAETRKDIGPNAINSTIENALRAAGLLR